MIIYIPEHLEKIEVLSQTKKLIKEYSELVSKGKIKSDSDSFDEYYYQKSIDSVKKFLSLCMSEDESIINYYVAKLLSFRGSIKIFDIMTEMKELSTFNLNVSFDYNIHSLEIDFTSIEVSDINLFTSSLTDFFNTLLHYYELKNHIQEVIFSFDTELETSISGDAIYYNEYTITEVLDED